MADDETSSEPAPIDHRQLGITTNGEAWALLGDTHVPPDRIAELLERAYASAYHWRKATEPGAIERARAAWMLARCHTIAGHGDLALHHAERCVGLTGGADGARDFDRGYAHEANARALALAGRNAEAHDARSRALAVDIADDQDREIFMADLSAGPWFGIADP